jgi:hypothetical protein
MGGRLGKRSYGGTVARLVHLNGPPGIGKSTLSALYADQYPGTLNLDVDRLHRLVGGWQDEEYDTWQAVWPLVRAMAATHLDGGRDVVLPQYHARLEEITTLEQIALEHMGPTSAKSSCSTLGSRRSSGSTGVAGMTTTRGSATTTASSGCAAAPSFSGPCTTTSSRSCACVRGQWWCPAWRERCSRPTGS